MIEVQMSKDIRDYEPKVMGPFTRRQLICVGIGCAVGIPIGLSLPFSELLFKVIAAVCIVVPIAMCGWVSLYGMHLEQFALYIIRHKYLTPTVRKYRTTGQLCDEIAKAKAAESEGTEKGKKKKKRKVYPRQYRPYQ